MDLDGVVAQLVIREKFRNHNIDFKNCGYGKISKMISQVNFNQYDVVFITDLNFKIDDQINLYNEIKDCNYKGKIIYIDHHQYESTEYLDKLKDEFGAVIIIDEEFCGTKLTQNLLKTTNEDLIKLVEITDIYDMWRDDNPRFVTANYVNDLFWDLGFGFRDSFIRSDYKFTPQHKEKIKSFKGEVETYINGAKNKVLFYNEDDKVLFALDYKFSNHFKEYFDTRLMLFADYPNGKMSWRFSDIKFREPVFKAIEKFNGVPGGHDLAGGAVVPNIKENMKLIYDEILSVTKCL